MGMEEVSPTITDGHVTGGSQSLARSRQNNDLSNPQQGTGAVKANLKNAERKPTSETNSLAVPSALHNRNHADDNRKLFVGGLPTDITQQEFEEFFSQFGELHKAVVMFDRETGRSRGFGFVTYVDPETSKSLLCMGDHEDGVGRIVMRGTKTCEVKPATPKGQAPTRGGGKARNRNAGSRTQHKARAYQMPPFVYNDQYGRPPMMYSPEGYLSAHDVPGYQMPMYHPAMPAALHDQQLKPGGMPLHPDQDSIGGNNAGSPYFFHPNDFSHAYHLPTNNPQQPYAFIPLTPTPLHQAVPVAQPVAQPIAQHVSVMQPVEPGIPMAEEKE